MRDCDRFHADLSAHLDGELAPGPGRALEAHLRACAGCATSLEELRTLDGELRALPEVGVSPQFEAGIWARIHSAEDAPDPFFRRLQRWLRARTILDWGLVPVVVIALALFVRGGSEPLPEEDWALVADAESFELMLSDDIELVYALDELEAWDTNLEGI